MPKLRELVRGGEQATLIPSFPCVTCPVQANMTTGKLPAQHGVVANGFYWRDKKRVEMWTAWNDCILVPQIWDILGQHNEELKTAVWFPLHSKGCNADLICTPAPIHNPDGSESLWCYTRPTEMYGQLRDVLGDFPLKHFWGPLANIKSTAWIVDSAILAARQERPDFFYIYLPHLDYAAQKHGPDSAEANKSLARIGRANRQTGFRISRRRTSRMKSRGWRPANMRSCRSITCCIPTACCAKRAAESARRSRRRAFGFRGQPGLGAGGSSIFAHFCSAGRCAGN